MSVTQYGIPFVYGVPEVVRPIVGLPAEAKVRLRFRKDDAAFVFIRTTGQICQHPILVRDGQWHLGPVQGINKRWEVEK